MKRERFMVPAMAIALMLTGCKEVPSSIDEGLQTQTDSFLREKMTELDATRGQVIVMEVKTGRVKAIVTLERKDSVLTECKEFPAQESGLIKPAVLLAALETGKVALSDSMDTGDGVLAINDSIAMKDHNWYRGGYGVLSLTEGLMTGSNIVTYLTAKKAFENNEAMCKALHKVGYEADFWKKELSSFTCIGYAQSITPLQTLTFFNAVANGGKMVKPLFKEDSTVVINPQIASSANIDSLQCALDCVVHKGLGKKAGSEFIRTAGATGTVRLKPEESGDTLSYAIQFCGYFPSKAPEYSIIVTMNKPNGPASGGGMAGPVFKQIVDYLAIHRGVAMRYLDYQRKYRFTDNQAIERITGVPFPELKIVNYEKGGESFTGDYNDCLTLEMEEELSEATYHYLDSIIQNGKTDWRKRDGEYTFSLMWGNGLPAPKGEDDEEDMTFSLSMEKGSKMMVIKYGAW